MHLLHALTRLQRQQVLMKVMMSVDKQKEVGNPKHPQRHSNQLCAVVIGKIGNFNHLGTYFKTGQAQREQRRHPSLTIMLPLDRNQRHSHQINGKVGTRMTKQLSNHCGEVTRVGTHGRKAVGKMVTNKITHLQR